MSDRLLVGTRKGLFDFRRDGASWQAGAPALKGLPVPYATRDPRTGRVWASLDHGHWGSKLARSKDGDDTAFEETEPPKYPESTGKSARYYWILQPGHAETPDTFWVGTEPGGLFVTRDDGASWTLVESLWALCQEHRWMGGGRDDAGIHSIAPDPRDPQRLHIGVSCAGVLETTDGGETWAYRNEGVAVALQPEEGSEYGCDPHCVVRSPSDPDVLWQQNHVGVWRSTDAGLTWTDLTQKPLVDFGFPIAVHPANAKTAWIVPMESDARRVSIDGALVVMRTDDGGSTWSEGRDGLPQANAWDFPFRHALDVSTDGETLAMGTTSGNLYVSNDGGRSWQTITNNLPTVYSVRFA